MVNAQRKCIAQAAIHAFAGATHSRVGVTRTKTTVKKTEKYFSNKQ